MASSLQPMSPQPSSALSNSSSSTPTALSEWAFPSHGRHSSSAPSTPETDRKSVFMNDGLEGIITPPCSGAKSKRYQKLLKKSLDDVCLDKDGDDGSPKDNAYSMQSPRSSFQKDARSRHHRSSQQDGSHSSKHHLKFERTVATQTPPMNTYFTCRNCRRARRGSEYSGSPQRTSNIRREAEQSGAVARRGSWGCASSAWQQVGRELLLIADDISRSSGSLNSNRGGSSDSNESIWRFLIRSGFRLGASVVAATATSNDDSLLRRRCSSMGALGGHYRRRTSH